MNSFSKQRLNDIETALNNDVPIFISEWGTAQTFKGGESLIESSANAFVRFLNKHNLSHVMFAYCESLIAPPVIPNSVKYCKDMFLGCSDEVQKAGKWNMEHRGQSYYDQN
jgi:hypothetical protein